MNLLFFTSQYPFEGGEAFVEDEINTIAGFFDSITIYSYAESNRIIRKIPSNAEIIRTRDLASISKKITAFSKLFSIQTFREICFLRSNLKQKLSLRKIHYIYQYYLEELIIKELLSNRDFNNDVCYSYWLGSRAYALSRLKYINNKIFFITRAHRVDSIPTNYNPFRKEILSNVDAIFPISSQAKNEIETTISLANMKKNVRMIVSRLGIIKNTMQNNIITDSKIFRIVSCSSIIPRKRLDLIIDAIKQLNFDDCVIEWVHFGDGYDRNKIEKLAAQVLSNKSNIKYVFMGNQNKNRILEYYSLNQINVFINASDSEGIPVSIMEALAYGIPCICRDVGGNKEIIKNNVNGYIINSNSPTGLACAISQIKNASINSQLKMRKNAYSTFSNYYDAKMNYLNFYYNLKKVKDESY